MSKKSESTRFQILSTEKYDMASGGRILQDKETGVLYLFYYSGYAGGLTPLLDRDGKPVVDGSLFAED